MEEKSRVNHGNFGVTADEYEQQYIKNEELMSSDSSRLCWNNRIWETIQQGNLNDQILKIEEGHGTVFKTA